MELADDPPWALHFFGRLNSQYTQRRPNALRSLLLIYIPGSIEQWKVIGRNQKLPALCRHGNLNSPRQNIGRQPLGKKVDSLAKLSIRIDGPSSESLSIWPIVIDWVMEGWRRATSSVWLLGLAREPDSWLLPIITHIHFGPPCFMSVVFAGEACSKSRVPVSLLRFFSWISNVASSEPLIVRDSLYTRCARI